ncbi:MAG TPA: hypothetical protein DCZ01_09715 [Elusimicrobia bacterium]|nr:MAG: hypothetical protein A2X37_09275 [Elusimicrobia bacterium GWA2_66_18]OGR70849.1 MAG: hypothetical protein A2X40_05910 [Elusimicrobia bacterium GWC2_65_9]HAZ08776.1 hypothetical protein [Elusimicrobiota bacterium]
MPSTFLERNKKKGLLAALLLFLRQRKAASLSLLFVLLSSTLFVSPSYILIDMPGGARLAAGVAWIAQKAGVDASRWGLGLGGRRSFHELMAAFRTAKEAGSARAVGWGAFFSRVGAGGTAADSLDMVKGSRKDLEAMSGGAHSIAGVLNVEDVKSNPDQEGVALSEAELAGEHEGFIKSAFAGGFLRGLLGGSGFIGAGSRPGDRASGGLDATGKVTAPKTAIQSGAKGTLSSARSSAMEARAKSGAVAARSMGSKRAFAQLAEGRGRAAIATSPNCNDDCPGEFATTNTGAIYDGNAVSGKGMDILAIAQLQEGSLDIPIGADAIAEDAQKDAEQMTKDAETCKELDDQYGPKENKLNAEMEAISKQFEDMDCGSGGCSKSKAKKCKALGDDLKAKCSEYMGVRCKHTRECPLTKNQNCSNECSQFETTESKKIVDYNDNAVKDDFQAETRMVTQDQADDSASCASQSAQVDSSKQTTQSAINQYRNAGCDTNGWKTKSAWSLDYIRCKPLAGAVEGDCKSFADAQCSYVKMCTSSNDGCYTAESCTVENIDDIQQVLNAQ